MICFISDYDPFGVDVALKFDITHLHPFSLQRPQLGRFIEDGNPT